MVRLFRPEVGLGVFAKIQEQIGGEASATIRGEEMMMGAERKALEEVVWGKEEDTASPEDCWEAVLEVSTQCRSSR